jgi:SAM-dependent methyltransferase
MVRPSKAMLNRSDLIIELNRLWEPVRPYLSQQVSELYGRHDGSILEAGPFSGLAFELAVKGIGSFFHMAVFPVDVAHALKDEARSLGLAKVTITESDETLMGVPSDAFDLTLFRGAFFFPSFFKADLAAIYRSLKPGGMALLGGGFGRYTPERVIGTMEKRSKDLNRALGRVRVSEEDLWSALEAAGMKDRSTMITEGGLWVVLRKGVSPRTP